MSAKKVDTMWFIITLLLSILLTQQTVDSEAINVTTENYNDIIQEHEYAMIFFCQNPIRPCPHWLKIFDEAADQIQAIFNQDPFKVIMGKVNLDDDPNLKDRFEIGVYPTIKIFRNGNDTQEEYSGKASVEEIVNYVKEGLENPIKILNDTGELYSYLSDEDRTIIAHLDNTLDDEYDTLRRVATSLKKYCQYILLTNTSEEMNQSIMFKPDKYKSDQEEKIYKGNLTNIDELNEWIRRNCMPSVEKLEHSKDGLDSHHLPMLILLHASNDSASVIEFTKIAETSLDEIKFGKLDAEKYNWSSAQLYRDNLPFIVLETYEETFKLSNIQDTSLEEKLKLFLRDYKSGKLHRERLFGPDPVFLHNLKLEDLNITTI